MINKPRISPLYGLGRGPSARGAFGADSTAFNTSRWSPLANQKLNELLETDLEKMYTNWRGPLGDMPNEQIKQVIKAMSYYYGLGYGVKDSSIVPGIQKSLPNIDKLKIRYIFNLVSGIDSSRYPLYIEMVKTGRIGEKILTSQTEKDQAARVAYIEQEAKDKLKRGAAAIIETVQEAGNIAQGVLPWYLKPKLIIPAALGVVALFYLTQAKSAAKAIGWVKNPIEPRRVKAKKLYKKFHDFEPKKIKTLPAINTDELVELGGALQIGYRSKKWTGKPENYLHEFGKGVKLMSTADGKTLVIHGGKMSVEDVGIVN